MERLSCDLETELNKKSKTFNWLYRTKTNEREFSLAKRTRVENNVISRSFLGGNKEKLWFHLAKHWSMKQIATASAGTGAQIA